MTTSDTVENPGWLPWMVLGAIAWTAALCGVLYLLPESLIRPVLLSAGPIHALLVAFCIPRSVFKPALIRFIKNWLACSYLYAFSVAGLALILLLGCSAVGYLPYSDRPGPGWGNVPAHFPRLDEVGYFADWAAVFLFPMCTLWGGLFFLLAAWSGWFGTPPWLVRISGGVLCGVLGLFAADAAGWYIAIAAFPVYGAGLAGLTFGAFALPRFLSPRGSAIRRWQRAAMVSVAHLLIAAYISFPFWRRFL